jgi:hypothetical protein
MRSRAILTLAMLITSAVLWGQGGQPDPQMGTWQLNLSKSKFSPGPAPQSATITIEPYDKDGLKVSIELWNARGEKLSITYSPRFDGKEYPRIETGAGAVSGQTITLRRIDARTVERIAYLAGKKLTTEQWIISSDGKTRYTVQTGPDPHGQQVNNLIVWEKQ